MFSVLGFSFTGAAPNNGMMFTRLQGLERAPRQGGVARRRAEPRARTALRHSRGHRRRVRAAGDPGAVGVRRLPVRGARSDGRRHQPAGRRDAGRWSARATRAAASPGCSAVPRRRSAAASSTSIAIARAASGLPLREVTDALQVFLGSQYVNDFDFNNRAYRVYVQADQRFRADPSDLGQLYARAQSGDMVPLNTVVQLNETTAPQVISHFNMFRSAEITGQRRARRELGPGDPADGATGARRRCRPDSTSRGRGSRSKRSRPGRRPATSSRSAF